MDHVVYQGHYGIIGDAGWEPKTRWRGNMDERVLPFDEEAVRIPQWGGPFPFLQLPLELRCEVYKFVLCYWEIQFRGRVHSVIVETHRNGVWLQHNPRHNPLALLAVNHQVYDEARQVFYGCNTFNFECVNSIPVFLIAIGPENAMLLRSVGWKNGDIQYENGVDTIKSCLMQAEPIDTPPAAPKDIWNDEAQYRDLLETLSATSSSALYPGRNYRLLRLDVHDMSSRDVRERHNVDIVLRNYNGTRGGWAQQNGTVLFELLVRPSQA